MQVTTKITVDLTRRNVGKRVNAVQGDGNTRLVEITLLSGGAPWTPPEGVEAAIAYMQPGGTKGLYNKLADGTAAISISGNVATVILAPQMLVASGTVQASLVFNDAALNRLTTFPFSVCVASNPSAGAQKVEDYIRLQWLEDKLEEYLAAIKASGVFDGKPGDNGVTFTPSVSENGDLSWSNDGGRPNPPTVNIKGPQVESTQATAAALSAQNAASNAERHASDASGYAAAAQQAAESVVTDVSQIKDDLVEDTNKLWLEFPYVKGKYLNSFGALIERETSYVTDYIPVKAGQKIKVSGYAGNIVALYAFYTDTYTHNMISSYVPEVYGRYTQMVEVPEGANYIVACSFVDTDRYFIRIICDYDDVKEAKEKAENAELKANNAEKVSKDKPKYGNHLKKPFDFTSKTSVWFGDSITAGVTSPNLELTNDNYPTLFASYVNASAIYNKAVSGSCIADSENQYSILNMILNYSNGQKDFTFISGGTNDYTAGKPIGAFGDMTADTFYGALYLICEHLKTNDRFVNSTVIFITPINQNKNRENPNAIESINAYRNAIYEVATSYGFNVVDGSQIGFPIESGGFADELCTDGVHPTQKGHEYYARALCGILM